jgi:hypothetical protein
MKPVWWMVALSVLSAIAASSAVGHRAEIWLGMLAPLAAAGVSWVAIASTFSTHPERLTAVMMTGFAAKLVFFGVYIALLVKVLHVQGETLAASFAVYFIALFSVEAFCLQRLFAERMRAA